MERIKRLIDDNPDAAGFAGFVLWIVLVYIGLTAFENHSAYSDIVARFFIVMGAVGIIVVGKWLIDMLGAVITDFVRTPFRQFFTLRTEIRHEMLRLANVTAPDPSWSGPTYSEETLE